MCVLWSKNAVNKLFMWLNDEQTGRPPVTNRAEMHLCQKVYIIVLKTYH